MGLYEMNTRPTNPFMGATVSTSAKEIEDLFPLLDYNNKKHLVDFYSEATIHGFCDWLSGEIIFQSTVDGNYSLIDMLVWLLVFCNQPHRMEEKILNLAKAAKMNISYMKGRRLHRVASIYLQAHFKLENKNKTNDQKPRVRKTWERIEGSIDHIINNLKQVFNDGNIMLIMFGSELTGLSTQNSDIDITLLTDSMEKWKKIVKKKYAEEKLMQLKSSHMQHAQHYQVIPYLSKTKWLIENIPMGLQISFQNIAGICNSHLIKAYVNLSPDVKSFLMKIKKTLFDYTANKKGLNSFAVVLMGIFFLQNTEPPCLPNLQNPPSWVLGKHGVTFQPVEYTPTYNESIWFYDMNSEFPAGYRFKEIVGPSFNLESIQLKSPFDSCNEMKNVALNNLWDSILNKKKININKTFQEFTDFYANKFDFITKMASIRNCYYPPSKCEWMQWIGTIKNPARIPFSHYQARIPEVLAAKADPNKEWGLCILPDVNSIRKCCDNTIPFDGGRHPAAKGRILFNDLKTLMIEDPISVCRHYHFQFQDFHHFIKNSINKYD